MCAALALSSINCFLQRDLVICLIFTKGGSVHLKRIGVFIGISRWYGFIIEQVSLLNCKSLPLHKLNWENLYIFLRIQRAFLVFTWSDYRSVLLKVFFSFRDQKISILFRHREIDVISINSKEVSPENIRKWTILRFIQFLFKVIVKNKNAAETRKLAFHVGHKI